MSKKNKELLYDYSQLFDILELELLPGEDEESEDVYGNAVVEYYNYLMEFPFEKFGHWCIPAGPEMQKGCDFLRRLLRDLGKANFTSMDKVWSAAATLDDNLTLLQFSLPHLKWMWN